MNNDDTKYTKTHEWVRVEDDLARIGISDYAQANLGDVVGFDLVQPGARVEAGDSLGTLDSVKAVADVYSPVTGEVVAANPELESAPDLVNQDSEGAGWLVLIRMERPTELDALMSASEYGEHVRAL